MFGKKASPFDPAPTPPSSSAGGSSGGEAQLPATLPTAPSQGSVQRVEQTRELVDAASLTRAAQTVTAQKAGTLSYTDAKLETPDYLNAKRQLLEKLVNQIDFAALERHDADTRRKKVREACEIILRDITLPLTAAQIELLKDQSGDEILGYGPLEPLLADPEIADIMINTSKQVYVEKNGKIYLTDIRFISEAHLMGIVMRIVSRVGRRIDEASPMVDARMPDGSRFNAIIPPLALDGCLVSIRKFKKSKMSLQDYVEAGSLSPAMAKFLSICANVRLNILISGGTGSGKTTLLNALSGYIDDGERIVTIEDAAELQLNQPHVLRLETRPASMEGRGEVTQRQLVRNALRMRPDRIILGEIRGDEVIDVLSAMNTGHDGSMATIHSNNPRDCLARLENLFGMSGINIPTQSLRHQIASAIQIIVQTERMRDGKRRITQIEEVVGMEGQVISTQTLFIYKAKGLNAKGELDGDYQCSGIRPRMLTRAEYFGLEKEVLECFTVGM